LSEHGTIARPATPDDRRALLAGSDWTPIARTLPDGRALCAFPLTYGRARIGITRPGDVHYDAVY
jgi:hypothetical protein